MADDEGDKSPRQASETQFLARVRALDGFGFDDLAQQVRERTLERPVLLLLGEGSDPRTNALLDALERPGTARDVQRDAFVLIAEDRRCRADVWERMAPKLEALTGRFGVPWLSFLTPTGETFFGAVGVTVEAQSDHPGLEQLLTFARNLHASDPDKARASGVAFDDVPGPEEDPIPLETYGHDDERFQRIARWLRSRQDLHALAFPGRTSPGLPAMLFWVRTWQRFRDRGLDVRLQRLLDGFGRFLGEAPQNPWSALWNLFMAARVVAVAARAEGLDVARAQADVARRIEQSMPGADGFDETLRTAARTLLETGETTSFLDAWFADRESTGERRIDWDHPSALSLRLEDSLACGRPESALVERAAHELESLGLAGLSLAAALLGS